MKYIISILLFLLFFYLILVTFGCQKDKKSSYETEVALDIDSKLNQDLQKVFEKNELMGMSVLLISEGEEIYHGQFGWADFERNLPVDEKSIFRIASISKTLTAIALMQLVEAGKVNLEDDASKYLGSERRNPKFPNTKITVKQLLNHTSSIQDGKGYFNFSGKMFDENLNLKELFLVQGDFFTTDLFSDHVPGTYFSYTNCTYGLIASIIEKVGGLRFDDYCRKKIFVPMNLKADFNVSKMYSVEDLAVLYRYENGEWIPQVDDYKGKIPEPRVDSLNYNLGQNGLLFGPQGSLRCSAKDLAEIIYMFFNDGSWNEIQILKKETVDLMLSDQWTYNGNNGDTWEDFFLSYGLGIHRTLNKSNADIIFPDRKMTGHPGIAYGLLSDMYFDRSTKTGIIFITNGSKIEYKYGKETTFYQVEEDVFQTFYPILKKIEQPQKIQ